MNIRTSRNPSPYLTRLTTGLLIPGLFMVASGAIASSDSLTTPDTAPAVTPVRADNETRLISSPQDRSGMNITLYQNGIALIQDSRTLAVQKGIQQIHFQGVSTDIIPDSALLDGKDISVTDRSYTYNLLSLQSLLEANTGKNIRLQLNGRFFGNHSGPYFTEAKLLAVQNGQMIIKTQIPGTHEAQILSLALQEYSDMISFSHIPSDLSESPTLEMTLQAERTADTPVTLAYLSHGFGWQASYIADITTDETMNLDAWVTLENTTSTPITQASFQLLAGEVNRATPMYKNKSRQESMDMQVMAMSAPSGQPETLGDYQLFNLEGKIDLKARQNKQVNLFSVDRVKIQKQYTFPLNLSYSAKQLKANTEFRITNDAASGLNRPMPAGNMRFYQNDQNGLRQFIGEVHFPDLDKRQEHTATTGKAFGLSLSNKTIRWDKAGWLQGEVTLINSQDKALTADLLIQPLSYRQNDEYRRVPLCSVTDSGADLNLNLRSTEGSSRIVAVKPADNGACRVSVSLPADSENRYRYEYRVKPGELTKN